MDAAFWHDRWRMNRIGFHQDRVLPLLEQYWSAVGVPGDGRVFVPLCGKSLDMPWLAALGHRVLGIEFSQIAVDAFFDALGVTPHVRESVHGRHHVAGAIEIIVGDAFGLDAAALAGCTGVYDRAALIALPAALRRPYLRSLYARLPVGCRGLLVTLEYPQHEKAGPPFSVDEDEVRDGLESRWRVDTRTRLDILAHEPGFMADGVTALSTVAYAIERLATARPHTG